jgi:DNA-binding transcriptional LysR family regulator
MHKQNDMLNLKAIHWFVTVVDTGGFTSAARGLRVAQPAVSAIIKKLERQLGVVLLTRSTRGAALTSEGARFLEHARAMLAHEAGAQRDMMALKTLETGQLSLGAPPMVAAHLLPMALERFVAAHPGVRISVVQAGADDIAARVVRGTLDLGLIAEWRRVDGLVTRLLERHPVVACAAPSDALAARDRIGWADLLAQPLIAFPQGYFQRALLDAAARRLRVSPNIVVEAESVPLIAELVRRGRGIGTLLAATASELTGVRTMGLPGDATVPIALCRRAGAEPSLAARAFETHLIQAIGRGRSGGASLQGAGRGARLI